MVMSQRTDTQKENVWDENKWRFEPVVSQESQIRQFAPDYSELAWKGRS